MPDPLPASIFLLMLQVFVARRDNARAIFRAYLEQQGGKLQADRQFLHGLREQQLRVKLMDETAAEVGVGRGGWW
jgi:hypothetical protein